MKHLSAVDAAFLHLETPEMPMHIGSLHVMDLPEGYQGDFYEDAKTHLANRLHLADAFTRKLALMPFDLSNPVWVEDEDVDIDYHVRHVTLPKPGTNRQLQQYVARLHSSLIDRSRPLWEFYIIDGLRSGQVALYGKTHHACIDGQSGVAMGHAMFDMAPSGRVIKPPRPKVRTNKYQMGMAELAAAAMRNTAQQYLKLVKMAPDMMSAVAGLANSLRAEDGEGMGETLGERFHVAAPHTLLNVSITNQRSFAGRTISLAETKRIAKHFGVTVNDVVLATTSGALRSFLKDHNELPDEPLVAGVPVSLREAGDETANNQVGGILVSLCTDVADPIERLRRIHASSGAAKRTLNRFKSAIVDDFPMFGAPWLLSGMASAYGHSGLADKIPPVSNVAISNVNGAPMPLYFAGARVTCYYPVSIVAHGVALNVSVVTYDGRLDYGLVACRRALPDVTDLGDHLLAEHRRLLTLAQAAEVTPAKEGVQRAAARKSTTSTGTRRRAKSAPAA